jgi:hypothetical protein
VSLLLDKYADKKDQPYGSISTRRIDTVLAHDGGKLLVYPLERTLSNEIRSVEFDCPLQFNFMICIPVFRLILGLVNVNKNKSSMILIGDASRKGMFLSKQDLSDHVHSVLYVHEASFLFIGKKESRSTSLLSTASYRLHRSCFAIQHTTTSVYFPTRVHF